MCLVIKRVDTLWIGRKVRVANRDAEESQGYAGQSRQTSLQETRNIPIGSTEEYRTPQEQSRKAKLEAADPGEVIVGDTEWEQTGKARRGIHWN